MIFWYSPDGNTITTEEATALLGDELARRLLHTKLVTDKGTVGISTIFLVLNHAYDGGPPVLWETMVFGGPDDGNQQRYTSPEAAAEGHAEMVSEVRLSLVGEGTLIITDDTFTGPLHPDTDHG